VARRDSSSSSVCCPVSRSWRNRSAASTMPGLSGRTVVSDGVVKRPSSMSSKPATAMSWGKLAFYLA